MNPPTPQTLARYGLTEDDWWSMWEDQGGRCGVCGKPPASRLVIDHDHKTGAVRGLLCPLDNGKLGKVKDSADWCDRAAAYLRSPPAQGKGLGRPPKKRGRRRGR